MNDLELAKDLLKDELTIVLVKDTIIYKDNKRGIKAMLDLINNEIDLTGFSVADKVVGKGAAVLFIYSKVKEIYTKVISVTALEILIKCNIKVSYDKLVENIINRKGDDICPMEKAVLNINDIDLAFRALKKANENKIS